MKIINSYDGSSERLVLRGLATNKELLSVVNAVWDSSLFASQSTYLIGGICIKYFREHGDAPGDNLTDLFYKWGEENPGKDMSCQIADFLQDLSLEHKQQKRLPTSMLIDTAEEWFNTVRIRKLAESVSGKGGKKTALELATEFRPICLRSQFVTADQIPLEYTEWLWPGWLAYGEMAIFDGAPGEGKSSLTVELAARVSRGWVMPPESVGEEVRSPANVMILSGEESWGKTVRARLQAAGADLKRIYTLTRSGISFPKDLPTVEKVVAENGVKMLIIDPIMGMVGDLRTDINNESHVRKFLTPLYEMTRKYELVTLLVRHFKKEKALAVHRGTGSQAWTAVCRLQHTVGSTNGKATVVLACGKTNLDKTPTSLEFKLAEASVPVVHKGVQKQTKVSKVEWVGEVRCSANEVALQAKKLGRPSKHGMVKDKIVELLKENGGMLDSEILRKTVTEECGISDKTYRNGLRDAGVSTRREGGLGKEGKWRVHLLGNEDYLTR